MSSRNFTPRLYVYLFLIGLFILTGWVLLPYPGLNNDEVLIANTRLSVSSAFHHALPLMFMKYLGALKAWLYAPILALFEPSYATVRWPMLLLGALTIYLIMRVLELMHGSRAAWIGGLLMATDTMFLLTTAFDWGPVALQHFFLMAGM